MAEEFTIKELHYATNQLLNEVAGTFWVTGEIQSIRDTGRAIYFDIVEKDKDDQIVAALSCAVFWKNIETIKNRLLNTPQIALAAGTPIKIFGKLNVYAQRGSLNMNVSDIDPEWSLGKIVADADALIKELTAKGITEIQKSHSLTPFPLRIAVVTSQGSAAEADFLNELSLSGIGFELLMKHSLVQGEKAADSIIESLKAIHKSGWNPDCVVLIRGGGSKNDLSAYNDRKLALTVAKAPFVIISGIGHEIDHSVVDAVAYKSFKTPTAVAVGLNSLIASRHNRMVDSLSREINLTERKLDNYHSDVKRTTENSINTIQQILQNKDFQMTSISSKVLNDMKTRIEKSESDQKFTALQIANTAALSIQNSTSDLELLESQVQSFKPETNLNKGYALVKSKHEYVRSVTQLKTGDIVEVKFSDGQIQAEIK